MMQEHIQKRTTSPRLAILFLSMDGIVEQKQISQVESGE